MQSQDQRVQNQRSADAGGKQPRLRIEPVPELASLQCEATLQNPLNVL
jgi:hypothetical protein